MEKGISEEKHKNETERERMERMGKREFCCPEQLLFFNILSNIP